MQLDRPSSRLSVSGRKLLEIPLDYWKCWKCRKYDMMTNEGFLTYTLSYFWKSIKIDAKDRVQTRWFYIRVFLLFLALTHNIINTQLLLHICYLTYTISYNLYE